jgi:hypothetical protein
MSLPLIVGALLNLQGTVAPRRTCRKDHLVLLTGPTVAPVSHLRHSASTFLVLQNKCEPNETNIKGPPPAIPAKDVASVSSGKVGQ